MKQTRTESLLTEDLYIPYYANIGQIICANVAALTVDWKQQKINCSELVIFQFTVSRFHTYLLAALDLKTEAKLDDC